MTEKNTTKILLCLGYIIEGLLYIIVRLYRLIYYYYQSVFYWAC